MQLSPIATTAVPGSTASTIAMPSAPAPAVPGIDAPSGAPLLDFPGVKAGDRYTVGEGTKVGKFGSVKGNGDIVSWGDDAARFHIKAGKFGMNVDMNVDVTRLDGDRVLLRTGTKENGAFPAADIVARTVVSRTNYAEYVGVDDPSIRMVIQRDAKGTIIIDATVPQAGGPVHIVLHPKV